MARPRKPKTEKDTTALTKAEHAEVLPAPVADKVIDEVVADIARLKRSAPIELAYEVGKIIIERFYDGDLDAWRDRGIKDTSFRKLADRDDLPFSPATLSRSCGVYELKERLDDKLLEGLEFSHLRAVLGLPEEKQIDLLETAKEKEWDSERLELATTKLRKKEGDGRGRPPLPRFVKTLNKIEKWVDDGDAYFGDLDADLDPDEADRLIQVVSAMAKRLVEIEKKLKAKA